LALGVVAIVALSMVAPSGHTVGRAEIALVQGGGEQGTREQGTRKSDESVVQVFERHLEATDLVQPPVDLVVWPEDVIDTEADFVDDPWALEVGDEARAVGAPMVVGTVEGAGPDHFRNAAVLVDEDGEVVDRYDKVHRVPFGEYVPFRSLLEPIAGDALPDRDAIIGDLPGHLDVPGPVGRVATPVSWEVFFADRTREGVEDGARLVLNPTNGASFTGTIVQTQQVAASRMRAIESGRWVAQVAPTGFSAVIDDDGNVLERTAVSEQRVIQREVELREGLTIYTRWGNAPALVLAVALILAGWIFQTRDRPRGGVSTTT
jgi:apolipoprotein N-acyltransferase